MTRHISTLAFLILISVSQTFSQSVESQIGKIREIYAATNKRIADGLQDDTQGFHYAVWRVGGKGDTMQWSAVGTMETTDEIWFGGGGAGAEQDGAKTIIYKIASSYKSAGVLHSRSEYYFDGAGKLVFVLASDDADSESGKLIERRFYYANNRLVRIASGGKNTDENFAAADLEKSGEESRNARRRQSRFSALIVE